MHRAKHVCRCLVTVTVIATLLLVLPAPAMADGGPILSDPELWGLLEEGQQIAVVTLGSSNTAHVDLFISMLDRSGESHEIVFFLPLGIDPSDFSVVEETSLEFDEALTEELDQILLREEERTVSYRRSVRWSLLLGTLFINGGWSWPLWILWSLSGCGPAAAPPAAIATYETENSQVAIYGVDKDTDLQALITTTGLDPAVQETLARLEGQQIAIVTLRTQPPPEEGGTPLWRTGQPGIHLAWTTTLVSHSTEATYSYPFGTGSAWAHPIYITRVYVVAPPGVDFVAQYPKLGLDLSGFTGGGFRVQRRPRIISADGPAYALENAVGDFGRVWRVTYMYSNSAEDVVITRLPEMSPETLAALRRAQLERPVRALTWLMSLVVALAIWVVAWRYTMPRLLGMQYQWLDLKLWRDALGWALLYPLTCTVALIATAVLASVILSIAWIAVGVVAQSIVADLVRVVATLLLLITSLGLVSLLFSQKRSRTLGVSKGRAAAAYIVVVLLASGAYLLFAVSYAALVGAL